MIDLLKTGYYLTTGKKKNVTLDKVPTKYPNLLKYSDSLIIK